jgi:hypothetical protein
MRKMQNEEAKKLMLPIEKSQDSNFAGSLVL